ncbi:TPA: Dot/Icm T4SS effector RavE [Legionella pneumophila]|nr:Dot/Icm T4SS effector RavE [Legionella pneumophila]HAT9742324.1 Dot/Icm T4SS effector RavE [Legionella pneumophila subsp. pneumophila]HAT8315081.1 Dot/Icm T4SS effector RavE [Legionella pneumophila]HBD9291460.1 Dot/Icm T4SS effector RavE [Legionella pneumophila]HDU8071260.1 Dot/Icm T4SS effector RavE [Legionella pneumophila]
MEHCMPKTKYALPPVVLYESHADRATSDFLIKQLPDLKKTGYTTICVDGMEPGASLEENISMMKILIKIQIKKLSELPLEHPEYEQGIEKLRSVVAKLDLFEAMKEQGFKLGGIDLPVSEQLKEKSLNSIRREQTLTDNTLRHVKENDGGVVVVLGFGHCIFQQMIKEQDENADQYLWYHVHNPDNETQAYKELVESYTKKGLSTYFPLGVNIFKSSDKKLDTDFWNKVSANCYNYDPKVLETSTASILKSLLGPEVTAHLRTDGQHHVDALISLETVEKKHQVKSSDFLRSLSKTLGDIHFEVAKIKTKDQVIIRGINEPEVAEQISKLSKKM